MRVRPSLVVLLGLLSAASASAWDLAVVSGFNYSHPSLNPDPPVGTTLSTKAAFDYGLLSAFSLGGDYQIETGLIRHTRATVAEDASAKLELRYSGWLIPLTVRFMRTDFLGLGFGPYFALLGKRTTGTLSPVGGTPSDFEGDDPDRSGLEVGLRVNLRLAFTAPVYRQAKIIVDGSYLFGFTDLNKSGIAEDKTQDLLVLVGIQIPMGESTSASRAENVPTEEAPAIVPATNEPGTAVSPTPTPSSKPEPKKKKKEKQR